MELVRVALGVGRVAGSVLRLGGRFRAAAWVGLILAVGWLALGLGSRADAYDGAGAGADSYGAFWLPGPDIASRPVLDGGPWLIVGAVALGLVVSLAVVVGGYRYGVRRSRNSLRGDSRPGLSSSRPGWLRPAGGPYFRAARQRVGP